MSANKPKTGKYSRTKTTEIVHDELDAKIYNLISPQQLKLPKPAFDAWMTTSGIQLSDTEHKRLTKIRRMMLSRVYAERTRQRTLKKTHETSIKLKRLTQQVHEQCKTIEKLKARIAEFEAQRHCPPPVPLASPPSYHDHIFPYTIIYTTHP